MSLNVGTDSYVTVEEADTYVSLYIYDNFLLTAWNNADSNKKEKILRESCRAIDSIKTLLGAKRTASQKLQFPRVMTYPSGMYYSLFISQSYDNQLIDTDGFGDGLEEVKQAQVENAVYVNALMGDSMSAMRRQITGVTSEKIGPAATSYENNRAAFNIQNGLCLQRVAVILNKWMSASCGSI